MAMKKKDSDATDYAKSVVDKLNQSKTGQRPTNMKPVIFNIHPEERRELKKMFSEMGITSFASGIRIALTEFKRNHNDLFK